MAAYFAEHGWKDILIAFPVNLREIEEINQLTGRIHLGLLLESLESLHGLAEGLDGQADIWIKVDTGMWRAGIWWQDREAITMLARQVCDISYLNLRGLLTHAGQTYHADSPQAIRSMYAKSCRVMNELRENLADRDIKGLEISVGDTPGCWLSIDLGAVDEIRPGNFVFFDAMMMDLGVCEVENIAVVVACPVVASHAWRNEVVIYGGAIHLSKEMIERDGQRIYGYAAFPREASWQFTSKENRVISLSQEHGVVRLSDTDFPRVHVSDLLYILPVHSCLAVAALGKILTLQGKGITTLVNR